VGARHLQVVGGAAIDVAALPAEPMAFQAGCVEAFVASWSARGFSPVTIENDINVLDRMLRALGCPAWEVTAEDVDRVVGSLATAGRAASTRRDYVQVFKGFHRFLEVRKAAEIHALFGSGWYARSMSSTLRGMSGMTVRRCCLHRPQSGSRGSSTSSRPGSSNARNLWIGSVRAYPPE
jgi:hypothetical protein